VPSFVTVRWRKFIVDPGSESDGRPAASRRERFNLVERVVGSHGQTFDVAK
jgi:hypothetical protein